MVDTTNVNLTGLKAQFEELIIIAGDIEQKTTNIEIERAKASPSYKFNEILMGLNVKSGCLIKQYDSMVKEFNDIHKNNNTIQLKLIDKTNSLASSYYLNDVRIESKKAVKIIEGLIIQLPPESINKLDDIKQRIEVDITNIDFKDNLFISIKEIECGHYLSSCLITARLVDYVIDQIPLRNKDDKEKDIITNKIEWLITSKVLDNDRKDLKFLITKSSKKSRDFLSHQLNTDVNYETSLSLLGDCVTIIKLVEDTLSGLKTGVIKLP